MFKTKQIKLVSTYFTPFAILLVLAGSVFAKLDPKVSLLAVVIIVFTMVMNLTTENLTEKGGKHAKTLGKARMLLNFTANVLLVYMLCLQWHPIWLLFVLTPVANAVYSDARRTIFMCIVTAIVMLLIYFVRGLSGVISWGEVLCYIAFIFVISLFVNKLAQTLKSTNR